MSRLERQSQKQTRKPPKQLGYSRGLRSFPKGAPLAVILAFSRTGSTVHMLGMWQARRRCAAGLQLEQGPGPQDGLPVNSTGFAIADRNLYLRSMGRPGVNIMRQVLFAGLLIAGLVATASPSFARQDRYCLFGSTWGLHGPCQFSTYEQCRASASGTGAGCRLNPHYARGHGRGH